MIIQNQLTDFYQTAQNHFHQGAISSAVNTLHALFAHDPHFVPGNHLMGQIALQQNELAVALDYTQRAVKSAPDNDTILSQYALLLRELKRFDDAEIIARRSVECRPNSAKTLNTLGVVLIDLKRWQEAESTLRTAVVHAPDYAVLWFNLGNVLYKQKKWLEAEEPLLKALDINANYPRALYLLGAMKSEQGRSSKAISLLERARTLQPENTEILFFLGNSLRDMKREKTALNIYRKALTLDPNYLDALMACTKLLLHVGKLPEAKVMSERAVILAPDNIEALVLRAYTRLELCDWSCYDDDTANLLRKLSLHPIGDESTPVSPTQACFLPLSPALRLKVAQSTAAVSKLRLSLQYPDEQPYQHADTSKRITGRKIRVAYLSGDFRNNATGHLTRSLYRHHNRNRFDIFAFSYGPDDGSVYQRDIAAGCDYFIDCCDLESGAIAERIRQSNIDILVDMTGYARNSRPEIMALRPAPIQVSYLFPSTSGADFVDYLIGDPIVTPLEHQDHFSERLVLLPHSYQVNDSNPPCSERVYQRRHCSLPETGMIYCCFNRSTKIVPQIFALWMQILKQVPDSVLWLLDSHPDASLNLQREARAQGVNPERLIFAPLWESKPDHLARHQLADLFLDTPICNAHTSGSDSLQAGVPLLTCPGDSLISRVGASLLNAIGLPELIARDLNHYKTIAIELGLHPDQRIKLCKKLKSNSRTEPLFDTARFARNLETIFENLCDPESRSTPSVQPAELQDIESRNNSVHMSLSQEA